MGRTISRQLHLKQSMKNFCGDNIIYSYIGKLDASKQLHVCMCTHVQMYVHCTCAYLKLTLLITPEITAAVFWSVHPEFYTITRVQSIIPVLSLLHHDDDIVITENRDKRHFYSVNVPRLQEPLAAFSWCLVFLLHKSIQSVTNCRKCPTTYQQP